MRDPALEDRYLHGQCYAMAIALHRETGFPIHALTAKRNSERDRLPHPAHAWVSPEEGVCLDIAGPRPETEVLDSFLQDRPAFTVKSARVEPCGDEVGFWDRLRELYGNDDLWPEMREFLEREVEAATEVVRSYVRPLFLEPEPAPGF